jgi:predicted RNA-binding protein YlxR (DUF448 family)
MKLLRRTLLRNPRNDTVDADGNSNAGLHASERTCVLTRAKGERNRLIRLALGPDGQVHPDVRAKAPGRGAWIGVKRGELDAAVARGKLKGALARAFKTTDILVPNDLGARIEEALSRAALERLGLEARASTLATGSERIEEAARKGALHQLYHAADASADGNRKLDQAWRVGNDDEGSGRQGLILAVDRTILSVALGRENVVHIGVIDARAAERVAAAVDRWHGFIDHTPRGEPCENMSQGSGPRGANRSEGFGFNS